MSDFGYWNDIPDCRPLPSSAPKPQMEIYTERAEGLLRHQLEQERLPKAEIRRRLEQAGFPQKDKS